MRGYITRIFMNDGKEYVVDGCASRHFNKISGLSVSGETFWEIHRGVFVKIADISCVEQEKVMVTRRGNENA